MVKREKVNQAVSVEWASCRRMTRSEMKSRNEETSMNKASMTRSRHLFVFLFLAVSRYY